jgi:hypothetical protein
MYRLLACIQKHPSLTAEEFKNYYENIHIPLVFSLTSVRPTTYKRRYVEEELDALNLGLTNPLPFDVVTEEVFESKEVWEQWIADLYGKNKEQMVADEEKFVVRETVRVFVVDECVSVDNPTGKSA